MGSCGREVAGSGRKTLDSSSRCHRRKFQACDLTVAATVNTGQSFPYGQPCTGAGGSPRARPNGIRIAGEAPWPRRNIRGTPAGVGEGEPLLLPAPLPSHAADHPKSNVPPVPPRAPPPCGTLHRAGQRAASDRVALSGLFDPSGCAPERLRRFQHARGFVGIVDANSDRSLPAHGFLAQSLALAPAKRVESAGISGDLRFGSEPKTDFEPLILANLP